jgi:hypothetical protein
MATAGTLDKVRSASRLQWLVEAANSGKGAAKCNPWLPQYGHHCRLYARPWPKNNYTSRAYEGCGLKAGSMLNGAAGPETSELFVGQADV